MRYNFNAISTIGYQYVKLTIKGDGGAFNFRLKEKNTDYYSYSKEIETNGEWQEIIIPLEDLAPIFRGQLLNLPRFQGEQIEQISILRANKKSESFRLEIKKIELS